MSQTSNSSKQKLVDKDWFPHHFNSTSGMVEMIKVDREQLASTTFLASPDFPPKGTNKKTISLVSLTPTIKRSPKPAFIFHSAFCCSTLLARTLDLPGKIRSLKEPQVTFDIADHIRKNNKIPEHIDILRDLLTNTGDSEEKTLIKPTNMANNLLMHETPLLTGSSVLLLYGSLRGFLISVLKKGEEGRFMTRRMYSIFANDPTRFKEIPTQQLATLTDLQIAAMVWLLQTEVFEAQLKNPANNRIASLHCDQFLANPETCLKAINHHFSWGLNDEDLDKLTNSDALHLNSKQQGTTYNANKRRLESAKIEHEYGKTLDRICEWTDSLSQGGKVKHKLSRPLVQ